jgi:Flp pilus assembly protein TadG
MRAVRRTRSRGQALTELALAAPVLMLLLVGGAQVGFIVYAQITVDTAAREGARIGSEQPNGSGVYGSSAQPQVNCTQALTPLNPVCNAVWNASGMLSSQSLTVSITPASSTSGSTSPSCANGPSDGYVSVSVSYPAPVFIPLLDRMFSTGPGVHTVQTAVSDRIEPCTLTNGR